MHSHRRKFIKKCLTLGAWTLATTGGWLTAFEANARWQAEHFKSGPLNDTLARLFNHRKIIETDQIDIKIPLIAENGAIVPITVASTLADVKTVSILVEKNPVPLAARFELSPELDVTVSARLKMAETSSVIVVADTGESLYSARALVKVTIGGCGG
ncbi:MAG: thiosulfate oxidation carrier protein SoxY [Gammaproteobacteria bacterium]